MAADKTIAVLVSGPISNKIFYYQEDFLQSGKYYKESKGWRE